MSNLLLRARTRMSQPLFAACVLITTVLALFAPAAAPVHATPILWLPTPPGENWKIIQGYGCGTHGGYDRHALDLVQVGGRTYGAPIRAAADGTVLIWAGGSGTLILSHGGGFYTQYTHMQSATATRPGTQFKRGDVIGTAGDRGSPGTPHLHFMAFTAKGAYASGRTTYPLSFAEGYDLPNIGGCNQHGGKVLTASGQEGSAVQGLVFRTEAEVNRWYNSDMRIEVLGAGMARGLSIAWDEAPLAEAPAQYQTMADNALHLAEVGEGLHTLRVRGWDANGQATEATFGPVGYDITPPEPPQPVKGLRVTADVTTTLQWAAASDRASGVAGYKVYLGTDPDGTSDWFVETPETSAPPLPVGSYVLRVQPVDYAGNPGAWTTLGEVVSEEAATE